MNRKKTMGEWTLDKKFQYQQLFSSSSLFFSCWIFSMTMIRTMDNTLYDRLILLAVWQLREKKRDLNALQYISTVHNLHNNCAFSSHRTSIVILRMHRQNLLVIFFASRLFVNRNALGSVRCDFSNASHDHESRSSIMDSLWFFVAR